MPIALSMTYTAFLLVSVAIMRAGLPRVYFAAIPGCWPGRALPTSGCPQPGRPRSGCALGPFVPHAAHGAGSQPLRPRRAWARVFTTATPARFAVWLRMVGFSHAPMPSAAYCESVRAMAVVRHARPAAHTLRVVVRSATLSRLPAHVRSSVQRGRQRLAASRRPAVATCGQRFRHQHRNRHPATPASNGLP